MTEHPLSRLLTEVKDRAFWRALAPGLSIRDDCRFDALEPWPAPVNDEAAFQAQLDREGYVQLPQVMASDLARRLADTVEAVAQRGIPPLFCLVYDEFWAPAFRLGRILRAAFGADSAVLPALWIWHIDPAQSERGWRPHRDAGGRALFADRRPKLLTTWLALSDATPLNGCMYIVPADRDRAYGDAGTKTGDFDLADVRALPAQAGDVFVWTQALLHWGSHATPRAPAPRISLSIEYIHRQAMPDGHFVIEPQQPLPFELRLRLIANMLVRYQHLSGLPPDFATLAWSL